jgi:choline dehydrogenase-like flavoprotein
VILAAGAIDTPKLLLLSGIGAAHHLASQKIELVHELPGIGKGLQDHYGVFITARAKGSFSTRSRLLSDQHKFLEAREQWAKWQTGPLKELYGSFALGFFRSEEVTKAKETDCLDEASKKFILDSKVPHFELILVSSIV